eukprot:gene3527-6174_t
MTSLKVDGKNLLEEVKIISRDILTSLKTLDLSKNEISNLKQKYSQTTKKLSDILIKLEDIEENKMTDNEEENEQKREQLLKIAKEKDDEIKLLIKTLRELKFDLAAFTQIGEK